MQPEYWGREHLVNKPTNGFYNTICNSDTDIHMFLLIGIAELLIFHPVDTVAKRLMSNKAKVLCNFFFMTMINFKLIDRFLSQRCHLSSSETLLQLLLHANFYPYSLVWDMLLDTRLHNECTSSVVNRGLTTSSTSTTSLTLLILSASVKGR